MSKRPGPYDDPDINQDKDAHGRPIGTDKSANTSTGHDTNR